MSIWAEQGGPSQPCVVHVDGELSLAGATALEREMARAVRRHPDRLVLDLSHVSWIDENGTTAVLHARRDARRAGITLQVSLSEVVARRFGVYGLGQIFD